MDDPVHWVAEIKQKRQLVIDRLRQRKRLASELADRRSRASQLRMKSIANLASDAPVTKRRRKGNDEDTFGQDDDDWAIYREIVSYFRYREVFFYLAHISTCRTVTMNQMKRRKTRLN